MWVLFFLVRFNAILKQGGSGKRILYPLKATGQRTETVGVLSIEVMEKLYRRSWGKSKEKEDRLFFGKPSNCLLTENYMSRKSKDDSFFKKPQELNSQATGGLVTDGVVQ